MATKLPNTIKIFHRDYDLIKRDSPTEVLHHATYGNHYDVLTKIEWTEHSNPSENVDTIIHEVLHGIFRLMRIKKGESEEEIIAKVAMGFTTVMKDNKKFIQALLDMLE